MIIGGVIIAGGRSTRMGQEKALIELQGKPIIQWIIDRLGPQVGPLAVNTNGDAARYAALGLPVIPDVLSIGTPLAGLHAALRWAETEGCEAVLTVPSDGPFLPRDLVARLMGEGAAVAASGGQEHYLTGMWPTTLLADLDACLSYGRHADSSQHPASPSARQKNGTPAFAGVTPHTTLTRVQDWVALCAARIVEWPAQAYDPFFNVNTPDELAEARHIAAEFNP